VQDLHRGGVDGVPAEVAQEIGVLFQHAHANAGARQQQAQHQPGWPAAGDRALTIRRRNHGLKAITAARAAAGRIASARGDPLERRCKRSSSQGLKMRLTKSTPKITVNVVGDGDRKRSACRNREVYGP